MKILKSFRRQRNLHVYLLLQNTKQIIVTIIGVEYKYFWPSGFLYISCLVPVIWMIELDLMNTRIRDHQVSYSQVQKNNTDGNAISDSQSQQLRGGLLLKALLGSKELRKKSMRTRVNNRSNNWSLDDTTWFIDA